MAQVTKDVKLRIAAESSGEGAIKSLADELRALAAAAGDGGAEYLKLADDLERAGNAARAARDAESLARKERDAARDSLNQQRDALARLRAESTAASRGTAEFQEAERAARVAILDGREALRAKSAALAAATADARAARAAEADLQAAARNTATTLRDTGGQAVSSAQAVAAQLQAIRGQLDTLRNVAGIALGGSAIGALAKDVAATADAYRTLSARVKLATGDQSDFKASLAEVYSIAQRTGVAVEGVSSLFTRVLTAGRQFGLTASDALRTTEALSQALVISGAKSEEAASSMQQFAQAIAAGVLQGDELKSLLENSPRLAQALADGLGVTIGKLKELGSTGALTSQQVIAALQGQSAALQREFDSLPLTLGRAVTNLGTAWQQYLGHVSEARGGTSSLAGAIDAVSKNLDAVISLLYSAGKAVAAFTAANLARTWLEAAAATTAAATATRTATAATVANTAATTADTAARVANTAAVEAGAASAGRFAGLIGGIKLFALVAVLTNLKEIGTAIGEGVARWVGYGKAMDDAERSARAQADATRAQAQAAAEAASKIERQRDAALGLNDASRKLVAEFDGLRQKGENTTDALEKLTKALRLGDITGIKDAVTALDVLAQRGKLAGDQISKALADALKGEDLLRFETNARAAFGKSEQDARRLKSVLDAIADESLRRAGTSADELRTGFGRATTAAINDLDALIKTLDQLGARGEVASRALKDSIDKALATAGSVAAVQALIERIQTLGKEGKLTGEVLAQSLEKARAKVDEMKPGVNSLAEAFKTLGLTSAEQLKRTADTAAEAWRVIANDGTVTLAQKREAFTKYAETVRAVTGTEKAHIIELQAAGLGLAVTWDDTGKAIVRAMGAAGDSVDLTRGRVDDLTASLDRAARSASSVYEAETKARSDRITADRTKGRDAEGFVTDAKGNRVTGGTYLPAPDVDGPWTWVPALNSGYDYGGYWINSKGTQYTGMHGGPYGAARPATIAGVGRAVGDGRGNPVPYSAQKGIAAPAEAPAPRPSTSPSAAPVYKVQITLGGRTTTIDTASAADQSALASVLRDLETAAARGG